MNTHSHTQPHTHTHTHTHTYTCTDLTHPHTLTHTQAAVTTLLHSMTPSTDNSRAIPGFSNGSESDSPPPTSTFQPRASAADKASTHPGSRKLSLEQWHAAVQALRLSSDKTDAAGLTAGSNNGNKQAGPAVAVAGSQDSIGKAQPHPQPQYALPGQPPFQTQPLSSSPKPPHPYPQQLDVSADVLQEQLPQPSHAWSQRSQHPPLDPASHTPPIPYHPHHQHTPYPQTHPQPSTLHTTQTHSPPSPPHIPSFQRHTFQSQAHSRSPSPARSSPPHPPWHLSSSQPPSPKHIPPQTKPQSARSSRPRPSSALSKPTKDCLIDLLKSCN